MPDWLLSAILSGAVAGLIAWGGLIVELRYMRRDLDAVTKSTRAAHWRLDETGAPPAPTLDR